MIHTPVCDLLGIRHPIVLGGMAGGHTSAPLVAAVSNAGGLGTFGLGRTAPEQVPQEIAAIRERTDAPFGVNFLLFITRDEAFQAALDARPPLIAFAWARPDQDLAAYFSRAHDGGSKAMYMAGTVPEALRARAAGADVIVAQGTEGGGHIGWMATVSLLPMVVDAVAPTPVLAAGGIADGRGLAAALALGAQGVLLGTRFLATQESPLHPNFKQAILASDGHDTVITDLPDVALASYWPGAMVRVRRNDLIARWAGREWEMRARQPEVAAGIQRARQEGDVANAMLMYGQDAGLIRDLPPTAELVARIVHDAETLLRERLPALVRAG
jgi:NAD(P)H-dependent flavin oxidoreductase YrpB (nitropropane dioxygenase family)